MKISIITINYNHKDGLERTILSVINQTCKDFEFIIIDGGSTDGSVDIIQRYTEEINYWVSERDKGIYHAMNKGVDQAQGDYCLFLNSGDILHDKNVLDCICTKHFFQEDIVIGAIKMGTSGYIRKTDTKRPFTLMDFWMGNPIPHQSTFIKTNLCKRIRYDETLKIASDFRFFMEAIIFNSCSYTSINCLIADFEEGGISAIQDACDERQKIFQTLLPMPVYNDFQRLLERKYEGFFMELRVYKYSKFIYTISVVLIRLLSVLWPNARFSRRFPLTLK